MNEPAFWTGLGMGLALGLATALLVTLASLRALWKRTEGPPPGGDARTSGDVTGFPSFGQRK